MSRRAVWRRRGPVKRENGITCDNLQQRTLNGPDQIRGGRVPGVGWQGFSLSLDPDEREPNETDSTTGVRSEYSTNTGGTRIVFVCPFEPQRSAVKPTVFPPTLGGRPRLQTFKYATVPLVWRCKEE
ncbi:hypothetical protein ZHAS_00020158 [Anopheles sinensis]|uniref:Uncharacterized protein n=1 Tax=Anopheles sinensis TaxID=74873 RepID=A0A084WP33_ANOSI|nr:hypothetical protein ZHAS_00020158 [Anopheles sinensis]